MELIERGLEVETNVVHGGTVDYSLGEVIGGFP
jgi:hypothetical protein